MFLVRVGTALLQESEQLILLNSLLAKSQVPCANLRGAFFIIVECATIENMKKMKKKINFKKFFIKQKKQKELPSFSIEEIIKAIVKRKQMLIVKVEAEIDEKKKTLNIKIPENTIVATTPKERRLLEKEASFWRWPAGSLAIILKLKDTKIFLAVHRDKEAPSYPEYDTLGSGMGASLDEIVFPENCAIREGLEEFIIVTSKGIVVPEINLRDLSIEAIKEANLKILNRYKNLPKIFHNQQSYAVKTKFIEKNLPQYKIKVSYDEENIGQIFKSAICFDRKTNGIDILKIIEIDLREFNLNQIAMVDGEDTENDTPLDRTINCYEIKRGKFTGKIIASFKAGKRVNLPEGIFPYALAPNFKEVIKIFD
jgi:hypothetical protein